MIKGIKKHAALFTIARTWKQPQCPLTDEWIKMGYIYTMEYYSAIRRNDIGSFVKMRIDLESGIQSDFSQKGKTKYHILTHVCVNTSRKMVQMNLFAG